MEESHALNVQKLDEILSDERPENTGHHNTKQSVSTVQPEEQWTFNNSTFIVKMPEQEHIVSIEFISLDLEDLQGNTCEFTFKLIFYVDPKAYQDHLKILVGEKVAQRRLKNPRH